MRMRKRGTSSSLTGSCAVYASGLQWETRGKESRGVLDDKVRESGMTEEETELGRGRRGALIRTRHECPR
jgi:hypothetical protein